MKLHVPSAHQNTFFSCKIILDFTVQIEAVLVVSLAQEKHSFDTNNCKALNSSYLFVYAIIIARIFSHSSMMQLKLAAISVVGWRLMSAVCCSSPCDANLSHVPRRSSSHFMAAQDQPATYRWLR